MEQLTDYEKTMIKPVFDDSKLTDEQRKALAIARNQGVPFSRKFEDLRTDLSSEDADELADSIEENRKNDLRAASKISF